MSVWCPMMRRSYNGRCETGRYVAAVYSLMKTNRSVLCRASPTRSKEAKKDRRAVCAAIRTSSMTLRSNDGVSSPSWFYVEGPVPLLAPRLKRECPWMCHQRGRRRQAFRPRFMVSHWDCSATENGKSQNRARGRFRARFGSRQSLGTQSLPEVRNSKARSFPRFDL